MNTITTLFFATLRDRAEVKSVELQIPPQTNIAEFKILLIEKYPTLAGLINHTLVSINHEYVFDEALIPELPRLHYSHLFLAANEIWNIQPSSPSPMTKLI